MLFLTKMFGVTENDAERELGSERACVEAIAEKVLLMQKNSAAQQSRPLARGTHAKGTCARGEFEVYDLKAMYEPNFAARLAKGIFAASGIYPAVVRFGNADSKVNSDFKADVRSLSFSVDLSGPGAVPAASPRSRQDFALQNTTTLPINDARAFLAVMKLLTASNPAAGLLSLSFKDKLRVFRILTLVQIQAHQKIRPYQLLRFGSNTPFRHGPVDVVKYSAIPLDRNLARPLSRGNSNALQDELLRHLRDDSVMSGFDFAVQFLDVERLTYWGKRHDANFWIENASIEWKESEAPFHTLARLTLLSRSQLVGAAASAVAFDVTGNATPDSVPVGSINRARQRGEIASRNARQSNIEASG
jgi:hypothetical protein